jgi:SAM-dependent methyltransferase
MRIPEGQTPEEVVEIIKDIIKDKKVCDVGCGGGSFMTALAKYAREVVGIEEELSWAQAAADKGFDVYNTNSFFARLPEADVYYLWSKDAMGIFLKAKEEGTKGTFIFGKSVRPSLVEFLKKIDAEKRELKELDWWVHITTL